MLAAQNSVDPLADVIGSGVKHQMTSYHLGMRQAVFDHLHERPLQMEAQSEKPSPKYCRTCVYFSDVNFIEISKPYCFQTADVPLSAPRTNASDWTQHSSATRLVDVA